MARSRVLKTIHAYKRTSDKTSWVSRVEPYLSRRRIDQGGRRRPLVGEIIARFGPIDILVNCQGWNRLEPFVESSEETWQKLLAINFK